LWDICSANLEKIAQPSRRFSPTIVCATDQDLVLEVPSLEYSTQLINGRDLTDTQWKILEDLIPEPTPREDGRGRPWKDRRAVLNGILWVLRTGAPWADVPERYPSYQTCHRRFQQWVHSGVMKGVLEALA
jgi:hypothetical protein